MRPVRWWDWSHRLSGRLRLRWLSAIGAQERLGLLAHPEGIWGCTFVGECTRVCPKHVDPAGAIQQYKLKAALEWVKSFVLPRGHDDESKEVRS